ncbi:DNA repair protein XRCC3 [Pieris brassicae]|uniref:DNA repair protein XRCC3 n=1 Tax=Pieris brassicae TaxID=7116 RepID=UPI001E66034C|nr:DNA repair protein XRCC3 [Pieris brassicae]
MTNLKNIMPPNMYDVIEGAGICTVKEIINLSTWDIQKLTNMKEEDINFLKNLVARYYCPKIITAEKLEKYSHIKTGCSGFDDILNGGFRVGTLSEIYGESGAGKTQLALQIAAQCGKDGSIYICTEDAFPVKRFNQLLEYHSHQASCSEYREKIFIEHITESQDLLSCVRVRLPKLLEQKKVSVIIVDSIAAPFRVDITNYVHRAEELRELGILLINIAQKYGLAVIGINQVTTSFDEFDNVLPSLGLAWSNIITYRCMLKRKGVEVNINNCSNNVRELIVIFGPDLQNKTCKFIIDSSGIIAI